MSAKNPPHRLQSTKTQASQASESTTSQQSSNPSRVSVFTTTEWGSIPITIDSMILLMPNQIMKHHFLLYITEAVLSWSFRGLLRFAEDALPCTKITLFRRSSCRGFRRRWPEKPWRCRFGPGTSWTSPPASFSLPPRRLSNWGGKYVLLLGLRGAWRFWGFRRFRGLFFGLRRRNDLTRF